MTHPHYVAPAAAGHLRDDALALRRAVSARTATGGSQHIEGPASLLGTLTLLAEAADLQTAIIGHLRDHLVQWSEEGRLTLSAEFDTPEAGDRSHARLGTSAAESLRMTQVTQEVVSRGLRTAQHALEHLASNTCEPEADINQTFAGRSRARHLRKRVGPQGMAVALTEDESDSLVRNSGELHHILMRAALTQLREGQRAEAKKWVLAWEDGSWRAPFAEELMTLVEVLLEADEVQDVYHGRNQAEDPVGQ